MSTDWKDPTPEGYRLKRLEEWRDYTNGRLEKGADAFAEQRSKFSKAAWALFVTIVVAAIAVGRLLQRVEDTASTQVEHEVQLEQLQGDVEDAKVEQAVIKRDVQDIKDTTEGIDAKLDQALREPRKRK